MSRVVEGFYVRFFWDWLAFISGAFRWKVFAVFADDVGETSSLSSHAALSPHRAF
ncbi:phage recombination protein Bet, partial [Escherichia coli EC1847]